MTPDTRVSCGTAPPRFLCDSGSVGVQPVDEPGPPPAVPRGRGPYRRSTRWRRRSSSRIL